MAEAGEELVASEGPQKAATASPPASECQRLLVRGSLYNSSVFAFPGSRKKGDAMEIFNKHF